MARDISEIGRDILTAARNELYMSLPYMDAALCALTLTPAGEVTEFLATDGEYLYYSGSYAAHLFLRSRTLVSRAYLHSILHCILRHLRKKRTHNDAYWDLACDIAVESILDELGCPCLGDFVSPQHARTYAALRREMPVLTAEGIYRSLRRQPPPADELFRLQKAFFGDDHVLWAGKEDEEQSKRQDENWQDRSERTQTGMESCFSTSAKGGEGVYEQIRVSNRTDVDYAAFLRRFAVLHEVNEVDGDAFDYVFYTYGLSLYGNMPLVEPPETREEKRIEDFVIAVDTSMSTQGELVREFLSCTYAVLSSAATYTRRVNIHILQCDDQLRSDVVIRDMAELRKYMDNFSLAGGSATDFRPVFTYVQELLDKGVFTRLRGLIYFTDGMGVYPTRRPPYDVAFVMLEEPTLALQQPPPWAIRLLLTRDELGAAYRHAQETEKIETTEITELSEIPEMENRT